MRLICKTVAIFVLCAAAILGIGFSWRTHKAKVRAAATLAEEIRADRVGASGGDARAEANLGYWYYFGRGVPQNYAEALRWFRQSADQGYARAQVGMGYIYYYGRGAEQDHVAAAGWFRSAADQGNSWAQGELGRMYSSGDGTRQDYTEAALWYRKAAEQGDTMAETNLGYAYSHGKGVPQDYAEAARWYRKAADQGDAQAQYNLGDLYFYGRGVPQDHAEAYRWFHKSAVQGDDYANRALSMRPTPLSRSNRVAELLVGLWLLLSLLWRKNPGSKSILRDSRERVIALTGLLWIAYSGLSWYGYSHNLIRQLNLYPNAFTWVRLVLQVAAIALLIYVWFGLKGKRDGPTENSATAEVEAGP